QPNARSTRQFPLRNRNMRGAAEGGRSWRFEEAGGVRVERSRACKERYPRVQVVAPQGSRAKIEKRVPVDTTAPDFGDPSVQFVTVPGTHDREAALVVRTPNGTTLVLNDLGGNIRGASGISGWLLRLAGFAGEATQIP